MKNTAAIEQIKLFHGDSQGYVALFQKMPSGKNRQYHYKAEDLVNHIDEWRGNDVYLTFNTFKSPRRTNDNIHQFKALYIDLDTYNTEYTNQQVLMHLEADYYNRIIPTPNAVMHSGKGLCLVYLLNYAPKQAAKRWSYVQKRFVELLEPFCADKAVKDPARILRLAGTTNSKNGATVRIDYLHTEKYELADLFRDYALDHEYIPKQKKVRKSTKKGHRLSVFSLYKNRSEDIIRLVNMRHGAVTGMREKLLFLYRYFMLHLTDEKTALEATLQLNNMFSAPLSRNEAVNSTKSAVKAYYMNKADKRSGYNYTNASLIDELSITPEEQKNLSTIISKEEKRSRSGHLTWAEHIKRLKDRKHQEIQKLSSYMKNNPMAKNQELADYMGCSIRKVQRLKAEIRIIAPVVEVAAALVNKVQGFAQYTASVVMPLKTLVNRVFRGPLLE